MNDFGKLLWKDSKPSTSAVFLDLSVKINPATGRIDTNSYFKPMNLFLYIPPSLAHPPGCLKGMIHGQLRHFWLQNSNHNTYIRAVHHFFHKLVSRGHSPLFLSKLFLETAKKLEKAQRPKNEKDWKKQFFHFKYHPRCIPQKTIRSIFHQTCSGIAADFRLIIVYSQPHNLQDALIHTRLPEDDQYQVSSFLPTGTQQK